MPHIGHGDANSYERTRQRHATSVRRHAAQPGGTTDTTLVGNQLLGELIDAYELLLRARAAGWAIADDGDCYQAC